MKSRTSSLVSRRALLAAPATVAVLRAQLTAQVLSRWNCEQVRRMYTPEATQAVAAGASHLYAIGSHSLASYEKTSMKRLDVWECESGKPLIHLNSGIVRNDVLYCAHSNYPTVPMVSSIEMWDTATLKHVGSHSFGIEGGSATWIEFRGGRWYVNFAQYSNRAAEPNRDPRWTTLIEFDSEWRRLQGWIYPDELVSKLGQYSLSGGVFTDDGRLLCTGHDNAEIYVLRFPEGGSSMVLEAVVPAPVHGQGIARDPVETDILYGIERSTREVVVMRLTENAG